MRTVTLEFLRHGAAHGHLLSPLARYMALCGSHEPVDVSVPFDHIELLSRLRALDPRASGAQQQEDQLAAIAKQMSEFLAQVPGLVAELADPGLDSAATHLRIIYNANELAILPFELANAAKAFPGAGQSLALQPQVPLCITREARRPSFPAIQWPRSPRILFAYSSSGGPVPWVEHREALERAVEPWVFYYDPDDPNEKRARLEEHLRVLPEVTVEQILEACACGEYTHIHLLAHGIKTDIDERSRYTLSLSAPQAEGGGAELVDGPWLATLVRPNVRGRIEKLVRPTVVTLAACNGADARVGIGAAASIAHSLHEAGIPLVVGSQFPLSGPGSVVLTQVLYEGLLAGVDPRLLLIDARRQLRVRAGRMHDWAGLVAYASFPQDLDRQLPNVRLARAARSVEAALSHADRAAQAASAMLSSASRRKTSQPQETLTDAAKEKLRIALDRLERVLSLPLTDRALAYGLLASARKRKAEILFRTSGLHTDGLQEALTALDESGVNYRNAFEADSSQSWALVQCMVLEAALRGAATCDQVEIGLAHLLSLNEMRCEQSQRKAWACGNLLELALLNLLRDGVDRPAASPPWQESVEELVRAVGPRAAEVHSTRRQLQRWVEFFPEVRQAAARARKEVVEPNWGIVKETAAMMFEKMPEPIPFS
jgi:hypothetical protein